LPLAAEGEFALSRAHLEMALDKTLMTRGDRITTPAGDHDLYAWLADFAAEQADADALARYVPPAARLAAAIGHRLYAGMAHRAQAVAWRLAGRPSDAAAEFSHALDLFAEIDAPWQVARTCMLRGALAEHQGDFAGAARDYERALATSGALGARPMAQRARAGLARLGAE
jgi:hypothetical protein